MGMVFDTSVAVADVGYLGPAATYTEEAARLWFGPGETYAPRKTVPEVLAGLKQGALSYAVVAVENTVGGPVNDYVDAVIADPAFVVIGEVDLPIHQTLMALPGATLADIHTVISHPQGLAQSREWLQRNLPTAKLIEATSTAEGARQVAEQKDKSVAAIAPPPAAHTYKLAVLAKELEVTRNNVTRFWVVTTKPLQKYGKSRTALMADGNAAALPALLHDLDSGGFKLVSVQSRPLKTLLGEYKYIIELAGDGRQENLARILARQNGRLTIRVLGEFEAK